MTDRNETTEANEEANREFNKGGTVPSSKPEEAETIQDVNEAADAEFNGEDVKPGFGNRVGGLSGSSD
ncbi:hypothetical protein [Devosia rhizoryzae]|uniref:Uncharacterized protein n=1 Tax=Devosia rhizoryzae TaxID=2774137 RepID=A0ABX7C677_9HYPH|nr:hypothetical protein [Devosia rhizoryzae]QQR39754.1 hypothetical protein JI748_01685 [Devosia rhizoryzae]